MPATIHTPEPWHLESDGPGKKNSGVYVMTPDQGIAKLYDITPDQWVKDRKTSIEANGQRIVACVNNCQGIVNPEAVPLMLKALEDLKNIMVQIPDWELDIDIRTRVKAAMTAIATAEGRIGG